jgi:hypothetical protein
VINVLGKSGFNVKEAFRHFFLGLLLHLENLLLQSKSSVIGFQLIFEKTFISSYYCLDDVDDGIRHAYWDVVPILWVLYQQRMNPKELRFGLPYNAYVLSLY